MGISGGSFRDYGSGRPKLSPNYFLQGAGTCLSGNPDQVISPAAPSRPRFAADVPFNVSYPGAGTAQTVLAK